LYKGKMKREETEEEDTEQEGEKEEEDLVGAAAASRALEKQELPETTGHELAATGGKTARGAER